MTAKEAIEIINPELSATEEGYEKAVNAGCEKSEDYEAWLVACRMAFEALKKQVPKKPNRGWCPTCGSDIEYELDYGGELRCEYCSGCGQAIDWEEEE